VESGAPSSPTLDGAISSCRRSKRTTTTQPGVLRLARGARKNIVTTGNRIAPQPVWTWSGAVDLRDGRRRVARVGGTLHDLLGATGAGTARGPTRSLPAGRSHSLEKFDEHGEA